MVGHVARIEIRHANKLYSENVRERDHFGDRGVDKGI
jgi:hypothetical protein